MDSDDENDFQPSWRGVPGIVILINVFENSKHNIFDIAQDATCRLIKQYMRSSSSHNVAVCLCGTEESSASKFDIKPVMEIMPLTVPTLENYKKLKSTTTSSFTEAKEFKLSDVLWHASKMFTNCKKQLSSRSVIMLTRLDIAPIAVDQKPTLNRASDLIDSNIDIRVLNISEREYPIETFYDKFLKIANKGLDYVVPKPIWSPTEIEKQMHQESHRHLAVAKLNFEIGTDFNISVGIYTLLKRPGQNLKKNVYLDRESNAVVTSVTKTMKVTIEDNADDEENSEPKEVPLIKSELLHYQEFGGERIEFTDKEMKAIKNPFGPPMMKLLGFKPATMICKEKWYIKMGYFLFPNEKTIEGSTVAFKALHKACVDMQMVAICILCTRVNAKPIVVALCPSVKPLNLDIDTGFDIIHIPFVESVRDVNINEDEDNDNVAVVRIDQAHKTLMKDIIKELIVEYKPDMFEDPKLQSKYRAIEAKALDEEDPFVDTTIPDDERFANIRDDLFEELFGPFGEMLKRAAEKQSSSNGGKKIKVEAIDEDLLDHRLRNKKVNDYTVAQLKEILKFKDIKGLTGLTGYKKKELVDLVYKHCVA